jgi:hypothetical protein
MGIDWQAIDDAGGIGKRNKALDLYKQTRDALIKKLDEKGSAEAKARANGRCEIWIDGVRCSRADTETHHMVGGRNARARGESAKPHRKQRCCRICHQKVTGAIGVGKLERLGAEIPHFSDRYRTVK